MINLIQLTNNLYLAIVFTLIIVVKYFLSSFSQLFVLDNFTVIPDIIFISYNYFLALQCVLMTFNISELNYYHNFLIKYINSSLEKFCKYSKKEFVYNLTDYYCLLKKVENLHKYQCGYLLICFAELWAFAGFLYLVISIPFNVICVLNWNNGKITQQQQIIVLMIIMIQISVMFYSFISWAWMSETLHCQRKYLPTIVFAIKKNIRLKLSYLDWFIRLNSGKKYGPFIFTIGNINYNTVLNVSKFIPFLARIMQSILTFRLFLFMWAFLFSLPVELNI